MKSKKVLTILLSMAIMLTFMPTFAFAAPAEKNTNGHHTWEGLRYDRETGRNYVYADQDGLNVLVEPTCTDWGIGEITCAADDLNEEKCGAVRTVWIMPTGHSPIAESNKIRVTADQMMDKFGYTDEQKEAYYATNNGFCEANIYECAYCGGYMAENGRNITHMGSRNLTSQNTTKHTAPDDVKKCAASFTCKVCGIEGRTNDEYNNTTSREEHANPENIKTETKKYHMIDTDNDGEAENYVEVVTDTCKICGEELDRKASLVGYESWSDVSHTAGDWTVLEPATCTIPGKKVKYCTVCGEMAGPQEVIDPLGHSYKTVIVEGDVIDKDERLLYSVSQCERCGVYDPTTAKEVGFPDEPTPEDLTYKFTKVADANCEQGAWIRMDILNGNLLLYTLYFDDLDVEEEIADGNIVEIDGKFYAMNYKKEVVPYTPALGHEFGELTEVAEATCTDRAVEAKVCSKCGTVDHDTVKTIGKALGHDIETIVVEPTCGTMGYSYDTCLRCGKLINHKTGAASDSEDPKSVKYDEVKALVAEGEPCSYEWVTVEEPTAEKDGLKQYVCSVCGSVAAEASIPYAGSEAEKADRDKALDAAGSAIVAADAKVAAGNLTSDSAKAITDAKAALDTAMKSGASAKSIEEKTAALKAAVDGAKTKAANKMAASAKKIKASKKKTKKFSAAKAFVVSGNAGAVSYAKVSGNKKISVANDGTVKVKKGLKKGKTYKVKVNVIDAGNGTTMGATQQVVLKVKIKK